MISCGLELVADFRSGDKLEIVIPTLNEAQRLPLLIELFSNRFDLVVLDCFSTDETQAICLNNHVTFYLRHQHDKYFEAFFSDYTNQLSKSGMTFYLFADEYVDPDKLFVQWQEMADRSLGINGNRVDWVYGTKINTKAGVAPRGFLRGQCDYNPNKVHVSLTSHAMSSSECLDVEHFSLYEMKSYVSKLSQYVSDDIAIILKEPKPLWRYFRRFVLIEYIYQPIKHLIKEIGQPPAVVLWILLQHINIACIAAIMFVERKYLMSLDEQKKYYQDKLRSYMTKKP